MRASLQAFTRLIHDMAHRAAAVYADLQSLDRPAGAWDLSAARVGRTIALVLAWCIFQIAQWPAFTRLAPRAQVLRVHGTVIETVKALEAPAPVEEPVDWSDAQVQAPFTTLPLLYRATLPVDQLRRALQQALSLYPRFAGRMVSHKVCVPLLSTQCVSVQRSQLTADTAAYGKVLWCSIAPGFASEPCVCATAEQKALIY